MLPVGGVTSKVEAAIEAGIKTVIVPKSNLQDIVLDKENLAKIKITPVENLKDVLKEVLDWTGKQNILSKFTKR